MADVAAELGMRAGSLYYYFDSKEGLLAAAVEDRVALAVAELESIVASDDPVEAKVRRAIEAHLLVFDEHAALYGMFQTEHLDGIVPDLARAVDERGRAYESLWVGLIEEGIRSGELRPRIDPWVTMKAIVGLCNSTLFWFESDGGMSPELLAGRFADLVLGGVMA